MMINDPVHKHVARACPRASMTTSFPALLLPAALTSAYLRERGGLPPSQLVEVRFEELDSDPLGVLRRVYGAFGWVGGGRGEGAA